MSGKPSDDDVRRMARESAQRYQQLSSKPTVAQSPERDLASQAKGSGKEDKAPLVVERPLAQSQSLPSYPVMRAAAVCAIGVSLVALFAMVIAIASLVNSNNRASDKDEPTGSSKPSTQDDFEKLRQSVNALQSKLTASQREVEDLKVLLTLQNNPQKITVGSIDEAVEVKGSVEVDGTVEVEGTVRVDGAMQTTPIEVEIARTSRPVQVEFAKQSSMQVVKTYSLILGAASVARSIERDCTLSGRVQCMLRVGSGQDEMLIVVFASE